MNTTNRAANRLFLILVGVLLIGAGIIAGGLAVLPALASAWSGWFRSAPGRFQWATSPVVGGAGWLSLAAAAAALVLVLLLIAFVARQGRGRTAAVIERSTGEHGRTRIDLAIPRALLTDYLAELPDLLATRVSAYEVRRTPTLKVSVRARRGVSPADVARQVVDALHALDTVLGEELPAYVQISGGFRARTASRARVA